jgi:hypothetical protein
MNVRRCCSWIHSLFAELRGDFAEGKGRGRGVLGRPGAAMFEGGELVEVVVLSVLELLGRAMRKRSSRPVMTEAAQPNMKACSLGPEFACLGAVTHKTGTNA